MAVVEKTSSIELSRPRLENPGYLLGNRVQISKSFLSGKFVIQLEKCSETDLWKIVENKDLHITELFPCKILDKSKHKYNKINLLKQIKINKRYQQYKRNISKIRSKKYHSKLSHTQ